MDELREFHFNPVLSLFPKALVGGEVYHSSPMSGFGVDRKVVPTVANVAEVETDSGSVGSPGSAGSILSVGSAGSILSIGSAGSILSIGSAGSILSIGSAGSVLSIASIGTVGSIGSGFSVGAVGGWGRRPGRVVEVAATTLALAALLAAVRR